MSQNNGVIRIGRKGFVKFAFGEEGKEFSVDVVVAFTRWIEIDQSFRAQEGEGVPTEMVGIIPQERIPEFHRTAVDFADECAKGLNPDNKNYDGPQNVAEALDFIARLREQYNGLVGFFRPKSREEQDSRASSVVELRFSEEEK